MKPLACILGKHIWVYTEAQYNSATEERLDKPSKPAERFCARCGEEQTEMFLRTGYEWVRK